MVDDRDRGPGSARPPPTAPAFRVATYNIRKCVGLDWRRRPDRIARVLGELDADIVAVQEADRRLGDRPATLNDEDLLREAGLRLARPPDAGRSSGWHGNAILLRDSVELRGLTCLDLPSLEPRGALIADVATGGATLRIACVHLGLRAKDRVRQSRALTSHLADRGDGAPAIVLGDLNEWRPAGAAAAELTRRFAQAPLSRSFHTSAPVAALDRIFVSSHLTVQASGAHRSATARRASDHLPVWADLVLADSVREASAR